jgi:hypothetical protein
VVATLLVAAVGLGLVFPSRNPEPWALLTAISLAVRAYVIFVTFFCGVQSSALRTARGCPVAARC